MALEFISEILLPRLLAASVQSALFVGAVLLLCKLLPRLSAAARAVLWWLVALQLVVGVVWASPLALPLLPADVLQPVQTTATTVTALAPANAAPGVSALGTASTYEALSAPSWTWTDALAWLWLLGLSLMIARTLGAYLSMRRMLRDSYPCKDRSLLHALQLAAEAHGLHRSPRLRLSASIDSPQLVGPWRPVLLLPAHHSQSMHADELDMALTHELVHLQRNDLWWGLVPAAAQHLFFFNPLAHLAAREYALAREAACDAAVLAGDRHCARAYGQLLLRLGVAPRPSAGVASASPTLHILKRRLAMLQNTASTPRIVAAAIVGLVAIIGVMPYRITAAPATPIAPLTAATASAAAAPAPASHARPAGIVATAAHAPVAAVTAISPASDVAPPAPLPAAPEPPEAPAPAPPVPLPPPPAPPAPPAPAAAVATSGTYSYTTEGDRAYVMLQGDETFAIGGSQDLRDAQRQRHGNEELLFVRNGNARYVIRDAKVLRKLHDVHGEMTALGQAQAQLGEQQGRLGEQQGQLGMRQAEIATGAAEIAREHAALAALAASREAAGDARATASVRARAAQSERLAALDAQQRGMSEQMEFLSKRQEALSREQAALGARQEAASARASRTARELINQAIKNGSAQQVQQ